LLAATALAGVAASNGAHAQTANQIDQIESQIKNLQGELARMKAEATARDRALKAAQDQAAAAQAQAAQAQQQSQAAQAAAAAIPAPATAPPGPPLPMGAFRVGPVTVTLGGFAAVEGIYRSKNLASSIDTGFNSIPFNNSPNAHIDEFRETAQQSRFSLLAQAKPDQDTTLTSYMETDFLSAGSSSNSNQSNSYTLRLRQFWGGYDNTDSGWHLEGGQGWSLATMYRAGLLPRQENVPLTIDAQYVVGFDWARQAEFRVVKDFWDQRLWAGLSVEEPQTLFSPSGGNNCLTGATSTTGVGGGLLENDQCGGSNVNSIQQYSDNYAPDIIAKLAADPGFGHYEVYGLLRFLGGRVSYPAGSTVPGGVPGTGHTYDTTGEGIGAGMILPVIPKMLDFQVSGLVGDGVSRYGTSSLPDATFNQYGKIEPLPGYSVMGGFVGHPIPTVDIYAYGGAEGVSRKAFGTTFGYGNPNAVIGSGCDFETGSCSASTSNIAEGTVGAWWRFLKGGYGTMQVGAEYEYVQRNAFTGLVAAGKKATVSPSTNENMFLLSFRYLPFQ
jgi:hypothetical protein